MYKTSHKEAKKDNKMEKKNQQYIIIEKIKRIQEKNRNLLLKQQINNTRMYAKQEEWIINKNIEILKDAIYHEEEIERINKIFYKDSHRLGKLKELMFKKCTEEEVNEI